MVVFFAALRVEEGGEAREGDGVAVAPGGHAEVGVGGVQLHVDLGVYGRFRFFRVVLAC